MPYILLHVVKAAGLFASFFCVSLTIPVFISCVSHTILVFLSFPCRIMFIDVLCIPISTISLLGYIIDSQKKLVRKSTKGTRNQRICYSTSGRHYVAVSKYYHMKKYRKVLVWNSINIMSRTSNCHVNIVVLVPDFNMCRFSTCVFLYVIAYYATCLTIVCYHCIFSFFDIVHCTSYVVYYPSTCPSN